MRQRSGKSCCDPGRTTGAAGAVKAGYHRQLFRIGVSLTGCHGQRLRIGMHLQCIHILHDFIIYRSQPFEPAIEGAYGFTHNAGSLPDIKLMSQEIDEFRIGCLFRVAGVDICDQFVQQQDVCLYTSYERYFRVQNN